MKHRALSAVAIFCALALMIGTADAKPRHRGSSCDGFHACRCGTTAARKADLPYVFHGINLKQARGWLAFERTSPSPGAVGYVRRGGPTGHVFTVVSYGGGSTATVYDDRGTYERAIGNAVFVRPGVLRHHYAPIQ